MIPLRPIEIFLLGLPLVGAIAVLMFTLMERGDHK
jgi:hypothetical protein